VNPIAKLDHQYVWHPFTQMRDWLKREPIVLVEGEGAVVRDLHGREYLDANSSIWTNLHGHRHPKLNAAIAAQLGKIAHTSALGLANEPASRLAEQLVKLANSSVGHSSTASPQQKLPAGHSVPSSPNPLLSKVFFSDNGSTAMEVALKLAYQFARRTPGKSRRGSPTEKRQSASLRRLPRKPKFLSLQGAYHGDTIGAVSLGHIDHFHKSYSDLLFPTDNVMAPYCYRCPYNRAKPERADARTYRKCQWECLDHLEQKFKAQKERGSSYAAFIFEPLIQGAAGMIPQPPGWLGQAAHIARTHGALLIADEVMTGFGRTGGAEKASPAVFACHQEHVQPDFMALAKGLTGGYMPMAATLTTQRVFDAFLGEYDEFKTFFHGHSFTGNQLGAAAALASLDILQRSSSMKSRHLLERTLCNELNGLWHHPIIGDIRQVGLIAGIELVRNWRTREPFYLRQQAGIRVCEAMARAGVLTRPIGNVIVLMPPYCTTPAQIRRIVAALSHALGVLALES